MEENLTVEEWVNKYEHLRDLQDKILFITKEENDYFNNSKKITVKRGSLSRDISLPLLEKIINDDRFYNYVFKLFKGDIEYFRCSWIKLSFPVGGVKLLKIDIVLGLLEAEKIGLITLSEEGKRRLNYMTKAVSFNNLYEKTKGSNYKVVVDGEEITVPTNLFFYLLNLSNEEYDDFFDLRKESHFNGIPKEHFIYALISFIRDNNVYENYLIENELKDRLRGLILYQTIDTEAINKILPIKDESVEKTIINEEFKKDILRAMPEDVTDLEKAIYIYIKLCKLLTYDDEYYVFNQEGEVAKRHEQIENVKYITKENNDVVCYEFNSIYAKLLEELGISFKIYSRFGKGFGAGHASLIFRTDKFLINADSVSYILDSDLTRAKLNQLLGGISCYNKNKNTKDEFGEALTKMYQLIVRDEQLIEEVKVEHVETFREMLDAYKKITNTTTSRLTLEERFKLLMDKVINSKLVGVDAVAYILQLRKIIFSKKEQNNNIQVTILKNNEPSEGLKSAIATAIFTFNPTNMNEQPQNNFYYSYDSLGGLKKLFKEEIEEKFKRGLLEYIDIRHNLISGIEYDGGIKR